MAPKWNVKVYASIEITIAQNGINGSKVECKGLFLCPSEKRAKLRINGSKAECKGVQKIRKQSLCEVLMAPKWNVKKFDKLLILAKYFVLMAPKWNVKSGASTQ